MIRTSLLALLACAGLVGCGGSEPPSGRGPGGPGGPGGGRPVSVTALTVTPARWQDTLEALGTARANESVTITAKVTETVDRVAFADGDYVDAGAVLVDLSGRAEVAELEAARAAAKEAEQQYRRQSELVESGTVARAQLDTQVAARDAAVARMNAVRARLSDRVITAPFDGVLGFRQVSPGTLVTPGTVIATLDDVDPIKLDFSLPETALSAVASGQRIVATAAAFPEARFEGVVRSIDSRIDPVTRAAQVRAELPNPDRKLRPGMLLSVTLMLPPREALVIPEIAVTQVGRESFVFGVGPDGKAAQRKVTLGDRRRGFVVVREGLEAGDRIVVEGIAKLRSGAPVKIAAEAPGFDPGPLAAATPATAEAADPAPTTDEG